MTGLATSHPDCMGRLITLPCRGLISGKKCCLALNGCMTTKSADYLTSLHKTLLLPFAVDLLTESSCMTNLSKHYTKFVTQHRQHLGNLPDCSNGVVSIR